MLALAGISEGYSSALGGLGAGGFPGVFPVRFDLDDRGGFAHGDLGVG